MQTNFSLQQRLLTRTLGAVLIVWVATAAFVWFEARHEVDELLDAHLAHCLSRFEQGAFTEKNNTAQIKHFRSR